MLLKLVFHQSQCKSGTVNRNFDILQQIRYCSDVVLMTVSKHHAHNFFSVGYQISEIRNDDINAVHLVVRK